MNQRIAHEFMTQRDGTMQRLRPGGLLPLHQLLRRLRSMEKSAQIFCHFKLFVLQVMEILYARVRHIIAMNQGIERCLEPTRV